MDITITLDRREVFPCGMINCVMHLSLKNKVKIKRIGISFYGEFLSIYCTSKSAHTNRNVFVKIDKTLWAPGDERKADNFGPCDLDFKASFDIPEGLMPSFPPSSMAGNSYSGRLQYFIKGVVTKVIGFEEERFEPIFIISNDFISHTTDHRRSGAAQATRSKPATSVTLDKSIYKPGELINCTIAVDKKDATCKIQDVVIMLRNQCWGWVDGAWHIDDVFKDEYSLGNADPQTKAFTLMVPAEAAPTLYGGNVKMTWDVHLHVKLSLSKDLHLTVPILVVAKGAVVPTDEASRDAAPGAHFCPACGSFDVDLASNKCKACGSVLDDA